MSERSTGGRIVDLLRDTVVGWIADDAGLLGAGLAYYGLLALAPLLLLVLSVTSVTLGEQAAEVQVQLALVDIFGPQAAQGISQMLSSVRSDRSITFTNALGAGVLLYASTRLFAQVQMALHICWGIAAAPGDMHHRIAQNIIRRLAIFVIILAMALVLIASVVVQSVLARVEFLDTFPVDVVHTANNIVLAVALAAGLVAIFKWLPCAHVRISDIWPGALVTTGLLMLGKGAIAQYLVHFGDSSAYGIAGTTLIVILFLAYSAQIFLLGAKFTQVWIDDFGTGMQPRRGWMRVQRVPTFVTEPVVPAVIDAVMRETVGAPDEEPVGETEDAP